MDDPLVTVSEGTLRGKICKDIRGDNFYSFLGIPYGEPPVGHLRFKAPVPVKPWTGIRNALERSSQNYAVDLDVFHLTEILKSGSPPTVHGSEDCLHLNVFSKELTGGRPKAVMVYIHGGSFVMGNNHSLGPEFLVAEDVVLVTIHYRLGALGFLVLNDPSADIPGNAGMKDMVLALKWVQKNIHKFGGNPNNVTIFGESAGAAAVHYLMLSPLGKGLFHRTIAQSGCALNLWAQGNINNGRKLAESLGFQSTDSNEILEYLQKLPVEEIFRGQIQMGDSLEASLIREFSPVVERLNSSTAFLAEDPVQIMMSGRYNQVPLLIGYTSLETMFFHIIRDIFQGRLFEEDAIVPHNLNMANDPRISKEVALIIRKFYYKDQEPSLEDEATLLLSSDNFFTRDICRTTKYLANRIPVYFYRMSLRSKLDILPLEEEILGVPHTFDLAYLFKTNMTPEVISPGSIEDISIHRFLKLWTNFAKNGNPNPTKTDELIPVQWKPVEKNVFNYLEIGATLSVGINPDAERIKFWEEIYGEYFRQK